jgi:hypothetical protein
MRRRHVARPIVAGIAGSVALGFRRVLLPLLAALFLALRTILAEAIGHALRREGGQREQRGSQEESQEARELELGLHFRPCVSVQF